MSSRLVLLRHGQSQWNLENRFTGWVDVDLSLRGIAEAKSAGQSLRKDNYRFDMAFTSILQRSIHTLEIALNELNQTDIPVIKDWRLNERHYGSLQGLNKSEMTQLHGKSQVQKWRRGYDVRPPAMSSNEVEELRKCAPYNQLAHVPATESLADTFSRVVKYWNDSIANEIREGKRIIISAHGNSLRALVKYLDDISDDDVTSLNIPTGIPLVYELDEDLSPIEHFYLADQAALDNAVAEVKNQTKAGNA